MTTPTQIHSALRRTTVQVHLPDGRTLEGPQGTTLEEFVRAAQLQTPAPVVAAMFNGDLRELTFPVREDGELQPVTIATADGARIYRRSIVFLLIVATRELFPQADVAVDHSISDGGYYCSVHGRAPFSAKEVAQIQARMQKIAEGDEPILKHQVPVAAAMDIFRREGFDDKVRLLQAREKDFVILYSLRGREDYFHGYMVPSTGYLRLFRLEAAPPGFALRYPRRHAPEDIQAGGDFPKLRATFREYGEWLGRLGIEDIGTLNDAIERGRIREIVLVAEALHDQKIAEIARTIASERERLRLVLVAGPSSAGKTTFARRLAIQLLSLGLRLRETRAKLFLPSSPMMAFSFGRMPLTARNGYKRVQRQRQPNALSLAGSQYSQTSHKRRISVIRPGRGNTKRILMIESPLHTAILSRFGSASRMALGSSSSISGFQTLDQVLLLQLHGSQRKRRRSQNLNSRLT